MINLLPVDDLKQLHASRQNTGLVRGLILTFIMLGLILAIIIFAYILLKSAESHADDTLSANQAKAKQYTKVESQAKSLTASLKTASEVLATKVSYTDMLINLTSALPPDTVIDALALDQSTVGTPTTLQAKLPSYAKALELVRALSSSGIAKDISLVSVTDTSSSSGSNVSSSSSQSDPRYPFQATLNLTYTDKLKEKVK